MGRELALHLDADGPDETGEFTSDGRHDVLLGLAAGGEPDIAVMESVLRLPGNRLDLLARAFLPAPQLAADVGPVAVRPGRFDEDAAQVRIARLGDGSALHPLAARVLAGDCSCVSHQLPWLGEAGELPHFGHDGR